MYHSIRALSLTLLVVASGCASLSKDECLTADWQLIGYEDGARGASVNRIGEHRKACAGHGVTPDKFAYQAGYDEGILTFCTEDRGFRAGRYGEVANTVCPDHSGYVVGYSNGVATYCTYDVGYSEGLGGEDYLRVCPASREGEFLAGYELGSQIFGLRQERDDLASHIDAIMEEQDEIDLEIKAIQKRIVFEKELSIVERLSLVEEMNNLSTRHDELHDEQASIDNRIAQIGDELGQLGVQ